MKSGKNMLLKKDVRAPAPHYTEDRLDFEPAKWGPPAWSFLHMLTFSYPENPRPEVRKEFQSFFAALRTVLPCAKCRQHFTETFNESTTQLGSDPFASRTSLTRWLIDVHNKVNAAQGKPRILHDQARELYMSKDLLCTQDKVAAVPSTTQTLSSGHCPVRAAGPAAACTGVLLATLFHRRCWA